MKREVIIAKHSGFCFGVKRATDRLEEKLNSAKAGEQIFTLGNLIHNENYMAMLNERGVSVIDISDIEDIYERATASSPVTVFVRAHGITKETEALLERLSDENPYFSFEDCTCPFVSRIHQIAFQNADAENFFVLIGDPSHPECVGIMSWFDGENTCSPMKNRLTLSSQIPSL